MSTGIIQELDENGKLMGEYPATSQLLKEISDKTVRSMTPNEVGALMIIGVGVYTYSETEGRRVFLLRGIW